MNQNVDTSIGRTDEAKKLMKPEVELRHLRVFLEVVETGTHKRAARMLDISQSTVSETLTSLERAIGTPLFRKTSKGSVLTAAGEVVVTYARRALALVNELTNELLSVSNTTNATFIVATVESLATYVLPPRLSALRTQWPAAHVEVVSSTCAEIHEGVAAGKYDVGLVLEAETGKDQTSSLAKGRLVVVASPAHALAGKRTTLDQLREFDFYTSDLGGSFYHIFRHYFGASQLAPPRLQAVGTTEGVKRAIMVNGLALGLLPAHAVIDELSNGILQEVGIRPPLPGLELRMVLAANGKNSPLVDDLVKHLNGVSLGV